MGFIGIIKKPRRETTLPADPCAMHSHHIHTQEKFDYQILFYFFLCFYFTIHISPFPSLPFLSLSTLCLNPHVLKLLRRSWKRQDYHLSFKEGEIVSVCDGIFSFLWCVCVDDCKQCRSFSCVFSKNTYHLMHGCVQWEDTSHQASGL